ncbi:MAG TPA: PAS domain-containing protein [Gemmatimonadaceae bacterium]|nr:PAS domain-containing protein [Gemmatimonadaceae bacterium]
MNPPIETSPGTPARSAVEQFFAGDGEMRRRIRAYDWASTPLGPIERWPLALRSTVDTLLGSSFASVVLWGPELIQVYNDGYAQLIGVKHPYALGRGNRVVWPEVWSINEPIYERVLNGETVTREDALYPLARRDGGLEDVYLTICYSPVRDDEGEITGALVTMFETTSRVKAAQMAAERGRLDRELEVERTRLEEVFRQAPAFLAVLRTPDWRFELVNDAYYQLVGHRPLIGRTVVEALPEVRDQGFLELLETVVRTGHPFVGREIAILLQRGTGAPEERYLDFVYQPLVDGEGNRVGVVAHGHDVTEHTLARRELERVNAELGRSAAELRASEERWRTLFEQAPMPVAVMTGPDHVYTLVSPRYAESTSGGRQLVGRPLREVFPELEGQGLIERVDSVYRSGVPWTAMEQRVLIDRNEDGTTEEYWFNLGYQPLRDASGLVYAVASVAYDVTSQVRARLGIEMAREFAEEARREAEEANQAKSAFLTMMSHELRTPLNAVTGYSDLLLIGVRGELSEGQREDVQRIKRSGQYLLGLINDMLNFAKLESGQVEFRLEDVEVAPLLAGLAELIMPQVQSKGLHYRFNSCEVSPVVHVDAEKLRQILLNLLANAVKFTEPGGEVSLECGIDGDTVRMTVRDTGRGIPADQLARVFDPFVQVDRHLTPTSQQGVGLGLSISRDLALGMGGRLEAESAVGEGSAFTLVLPMNR